MVVAVIDTLIDLSKFIDKNLIEYIVLTPEKENKSINSHSNDVCNIIVRENRNAEIILISIIDERKITKLDLLIEALEILLVKKIDIINISLGIESSEYTEKIKKLYRLCEKFYNMGIPIISSYSNKHIATFPAAFNNVIGIDSSNDEISINNIINIDYINNDIVFMWDSVSIFNEKSIFIKGNSFLTALVTGILSNFIECNQYNNLENINIIFKEYAEKIFYFPENEFKDIPAIKIIDDESLSLFSSFNIAKIEKKIEVNQLYKEKIFNSIYDCSVIIFDINKPEIFYENINLLNNLLNYIPSDITILSYSALFSCYQRYMIYLKNNNSIRCLSF